VNHVHFVGKAGIDGTEGDYTDHTENDDNSPLVMSSQIRRGFSNEDGHITYMSVFVTGVPTRKRAKRKLKTRDVDPSGATYSTVDTIR
jgi:hypothetical protein